MSKSLRITPAELFAKVDGVKANAYGTEQKMDWLNKVEGMVQVEILKRAEDEIVMYDWSEDKNRPLLVPHPYTDLYVYYLYAMIDYANREIGSYNNNMTMFNSAYEAYQGHYNETADKSFRFVHYW